ncbi:MAG: NAD-dependent protein deacetylase [Thermoanaerobaculia bacterium]|nr:NAD-dependent protein deacetylase [Thermoanaerobaculia bacterium]
MGEAAAATDDIDVAAAALARFITAAGQVVVLSGAGCSTESGIPDYRSPGGAWSRHKPVQFGEFVRSAAARRRYWARSYAGWSRFAAAQPNPAHAAIRTLEDLGLLAHVITQNVDGLHQRAGSRGVIELHGSNHRVVCLACDGAWPREEIQSRIRDANPHWVAANSAAAPDGDADLSDEDIETFETPRCPECGGDLKPDVVFFGENVPRDRVERSFAIVDDARAMLVVGSSLTVWSGYRFVLAAKDRGKPVAILNIGPTRGDALATLRVAATCGPALSRAVERIAFDNR